MRKLIYAVLLLLGITLLIGQMAEVQALGEILQEGDWRFLFLGLALLAAWLLNVAVSYKAIFQAVGVEESLRKLILLSSAALFVNIVAPTAGVGGMAVFISEARRRGYSSGRVTVAGVLYVLFDYAAVLCVLAVGFVVLLRRNNLTIAEISAAALLLLLAGGLATLLFLGMRSEHALAGVLAWGVQRMNNLVRPFTHRAYLSEERARSFAHDAAEGLRHLNGGWRRLLAPFILAFSSKVLLIIILTCCFLAFNVPFSAGTIIAGFSIGYLFLIISPTPSGIGIVEGALTLALRSLLVPLEAAALITLAYRIFTFWLPLLFGVFAFRLLVQSGEVEEIKEPSAKNRPIPDIKELL